MHVLHGHQPFGEHGVELREQCVHLGRIVNHLEHNIDDPRCTIVLVSHQAPGSLGRKLKDRGPTVHFRVRAWNKWAEVVELSGFSGHADHSDLVALLRPLAGQAKVRLVHGDPIHVEMLAQALRAEGFTDVHAPARGEKVSVA